MARWRMAWRRLAWARLARRRMAGDTLGLGSALGLAWLGMGCRSGRGRRFTSLLVQPIWLGALPLGLSLSVSPNHRLQAEPSASC